LKKSRFACLLCVMAISVMPKVFASINTKGLWLPKSYQKYLPQLMLAAQQAEKTERCMHVMNGGLHNQKPNEEQVVFRITCRDEDKLSYNLRYTFFIAQEKMVLSHEQKSRQRIEKEKAALKAEQEKEERLRQEREAKEKLTAEIFALAEEEARKAESQRSEKDLMNADIEDVLERLDELVGVPVDEALAWQSCLDGLKAKVRGMKSLVIEDNPRPESRVVDRVEREFDIDFQAKNPQFRDLFYRANCRVFQDGSTTIKIKARKP